ncbi:MAG: phosphatase PAP2 family protein [Blastocatellia bacterium]|nr:phosphatase PAP2 family protein [Blastocatellia bacterium]
MTNPPFRVWNNFKSFFPVVAILYAGYQVTNRFHAIEPQRLPMTSLDHAIPFLLWSVWPYFGLIMLLALPLFIRTERLFRRSVLAITVAVCLNLLCYTVMPTTYPRPPLPEGDTFSHAAYRWLCSIDTPANCFPSGHITSPAISYWALAQENPMLIWWFRAIFALLALSILTTKQHYVFDLFGGLASAGIGILASGWMAANRKEAA